MKNLWNTIVHAITRFFSLIFERFGKKKAILLIVSGSVVLLSAIITPFFFIFGEDEPDDPHTCAGVSWVTEKEATCTEEGSKKFVCSCGKTVKTEKIPLAPHTEENVPGKAATCTEKGLTDGKKCSVCGETLVEQQVISALGHSFENGVCIRCGIPSASDLNDMIFHRDYISNYSADKLFLTYEDFAAYIAENTFSEAEELAKYDREYFEENVLVVAIQTYNHGGHQFRVSGEIEGKTYNLNVETCSADDASMGAWAPQTYWVAVELPKDALAGMDLLAVYHHKSLVSEFDLSGACKHLNVYTEIVAPTCIADGAEKHICLDCKEIITMNAILATGHTFGDWYTIAPNGCASEEYSMRICTKCFYIEYNIDSSTNVHPHDFELTLVEASCTESGRATVTCKNCGLVGADEILPPLGHNLNWVFTAETHGKECVREGCDYALAPEAHVADGNTSPCVDTRCTVCGYILAEGLGHEFSDTYESDANGHWHACSREGCDWIHSYGKHRNPNAICKDTSAICNICGANFVPNGAHVFGEWQTLQKPTCTEPGVLRRDCSYCSHYVLDSIPANGHDMGAWYTVQAPTENTNGIRRRDCNVCDYYETKTIVATGHVFGTWHVTKAPTCTESGEMQRECRNCGYVQTATLSALGHSVSA